MLPLATFVLLQSTLKYTTAQTIPHVTYYWKTTSVTDKVYDYWNHGPIYIPGMHDVFTLTTKSRDIFPPWLTRSTTQSIKDSVPITHTIIEPKTTEQAATSISSAETTNTSISTTATPINEKASTTDLPTDKPKTIETEPTKTTATATVHQTANSETIKELLTKPTEPTNKTSTDKLSTEVENDNETTEPFSVFLRKFFKSLTAKALPELPALVAPFVPYMDEVIKDKKLDWLGEKLIAYLKKMVRSLEKMLSASPDLLHTKCYQAYNLLSNRHTALEKDINELLNLLDDLYDEAEEEAMQDVLHDIIQFPNDNKTGQEIAKNFVDDVILTPMKRVSGTSRGDILVLMLTDITEKRELYLRRYLKNIYRNLNDNTARSYRNDIKRPVQKFGISSFETSGHETYRKKKSVTYSRHQKLTHVRIAKYTEGIYQTVRSNMENIRSLMDNVELSSSETNEYELSVDSDESEEKNATGRTKNIHFRIGREDKSFKTSNDKISKVKEKYQVISENIGQFDKNKIIQRGYYVNHRTSKPERYKNKKNTMLIPKLTFLTKLVKNNVLEFDGSKTILNHKNIVSQNNDFSKDAKKRITESIKETILKDNKRFGYYLGPLEKYILENNKLDTKHVTNQSNHQLKLVSQTKKHDRFHVKMRPDYPDISKHTKSTQLYKGIPITLLTYQYTKNRNEPKLSKGTTKSYIETPSVQSRYKKIAQLSISDKEYRESEDNMSYAEYSSDDTGDTSKENHVNIDKRTAPHAQWHLQGRENSRMHQKYFRNQHHGHKHRHKKRRHKHGHRHSHYGKRKYKNLKRKYQRLKQILAQQGVNDDSKKPMENKINNDFNKKLGDINTKYRETSPSSFNNLTKKVLRINISDKPDAKINFGQKHVATTTTVKEKVGVKKINMFLDDYNGKIESNINSQAKIPNKSHELTLRDMTTTQAYTLLDYGIMFRKAYLQNTTAVKPNDVIAEDSDTEKELKKNIYDAFRHMDFINYNASRRSIHHDTTPTINLEDSQETDVEAVLKSNIYKAVKKLLKK